MTAVVTITDTTGETVMINPLNVDTVEPHGKDGVAIHMVSGRRITAGGTTVEVVAEALGNALGGSRGAL